MVKRGGMGLGSHQPKPQACVGETRGAQGSVGGWGGGGGGSWKEPSPTSEAASLGARAARVWPCAPAWLSLSHCRREDVGREGCGTFKETLTAAVSLQKAPAAIHILDQSGGGRREAQQ